MRGRSFIQPGTEVECAFIERDARVRGTLRLPDMADSGRARFVESLPIDLSAPQLPPVPIVLLEGAHSTTGLLLESFATSISLGFPLPQPFPVQLLVNRVLIGADDPEQLYSAATVTCGSLLDFFGSSALTPEQVVREGDAREQRAAASIGETKVVLGETAAMRNERVTASLEWSAELTMSGPPATLGAWSQRLLGVLRLFALLADRPMPPHRLCGHMPGGHADLYCSWPEPAAPSTTVPLATLPVVADRLDALLRAWERLQHKAPDLLNHIDRFESFRLREGQPDHVLTLARCLELFHDYASEFDSVTRPKAEHRQLVDALLGGMPLDLARDHEGWIRSALLEANRKRLVSQIEDITAAAGREVTDACRIVDPGAFASVVKRARNHLTHPTGPPPRDLPEGRDLIIMINQMWFLVRACILRELGFASPEIVQALNRSAEKHYLLEQ